MASLIERGVRDTSFATKRGRRRDGRTGRQALPPSRRFSASFAPRRRATRLICAALPAFIVAVSIAELPTTVLNILCVALGLGLVIFFHELGHFAVAKWCNVLVERFSIGFGPILWSRKWGETEYALSAVPFGGYVKMLGQDDMDPSQLTSDEIAQDPRSYSAKPVWQRIAIISAGVTMNILTAVLFFAGAYGLGVTAPAPVAGGISIGGPAWRAGIRTGDTINAIDGREVTQFPDITRAVVLSTGPITIDGTHADGEQYSVTLTPDRKGTRREIGLGFPMATRVAQLEDPAMAPVVPGTPAAEANPPLEQGDRIEAIDGEPMESFSDLLEVLARKRAETVTFNIVRGEEQIDVEVGPNPARTLGARFEVGRIVAVQRGSIAEKAGIEPGDRITRIDGEDVGHQIDPLRLPYLFSDRAGQPVELQIQRDSKSGGSEPVTLSLTPADRTGWTEQPLTPGEPLAIPAIGVAFHIVPRVLAIAPDGPAAKAKLKDGDLIESMRLVLPEGVPAEPGYDGSPIEIAMNDKVDDRTVQNFAYAFTKMQEFPQRIVELTVREGNKTRVAQLKPWSDPEATWYMPTRGFRAPVMTSKFQARSFGHAMALGVSGTRNTVVELYLTLRNLLTFDLSYKELSGPIRIAEIAYSLADQGVAQLLWFLAILSVNLAVLNFLPIPVLDGGHMVFLIWEAVTRRKPSEQVVAAATYLGMFFILALMGTVIWLDLFVHRAFRG